MNILSKSFLYGVKWVGLSSLFVQVITAIKFFYFGRILDTSTFGFISTGFLILNFFETFMKLGFKEAIIKSKNSSQNLFNTLFTINIIKSIFFLTLIIVFLISKGDYSLLIVFVLTVLLFKHLENPYLILKEKLLEVKLISYFNVIPSLIDIIISIFLYKVFDNFYHFFTGIIISQFLKNIFSYLLCEIPILDLDKMTLKNNFSFGVTIQLNRILGYISSQFDSLIIFKSLSLSELGLYQMSLRFGNIIPQLSANTISTYFFPLLTKKENKEKINTDILLKNLILLFKIAAPITVLLSIYGPIILTKILGENWSLIKFPSSILFIAGLMRLYYSIIETIILAKYNFKNTIFFNLIRILIFMLITVLLIKYGIDGISISHIISLGFSILPLFLHVFKLSGFICFLRECFFTIFLITSILTTYFMLNTFHHFTIFIFSLIFYYYQILRHEISNKL